MMMELTEEESWKKGGSLNRRKKVWEATYPSSLTIWFWATRIIQIHRYTCRRTLWTVLLISYLVFFFFSTGHFCLPNSASLFCLVLSLLRLFGVFFLEKRLAQIKDSPVLVVSVGMSPVFLFFLIFFSGGRCRMSMDLLFFRTWNFNARQRPS